ncbi:hypothetical protein ACFL35_13625 [Candidatus Riflebacteria bacterium]
MLKQLSIDDLKKSFLPVFFLLLLISLVFSPCLKNEFINWDDDQNIYLNTVFQEKDALKKIWFSFKMPAYLPVTNSLWYLQRSIFGVKGSSAFYFHLVSLFVYLLNALLLYFLMLRFNLAPLLSFFITLFFAIHPWRVETVAWVTEQKSLFSGFFLLLSWHFFISIKSSNPFKELAYWASVIFFLPVNFFQSNPYFIPPYFFPGQLFF